jgi:hypothetical protein
MSEPTYRPLRQGDVKDDDAAVIDSFLVETTDSPRPVATDLVTPGQPRDSKKRTTALITGNATLSIIAGTVPQLLLPADAGRKSVTFTIKGALATDAALVSSDSADIIPPTTGVPPRTAFLIPVAAGSLTLPDHTGPIYASAEGASADILISWAAVSE